MINVFIVVFKLLIKSGLVIFLYLNGQKTIANSGL